MVGDVMGASKSTQTYNFYTKWYLFWKTDLFISEDLKAFSPLLFVYHLYPWRSSTSDLQNLLLYNQRTIVFNIIVKELKNNRRKITFPLLQMSLLSLNILLLSSFPKWPWGNQKTKNATWTRSWCLFRVSKHLHEKIFATW